MAAGIVEILAKGTMKAAVLHSRDQQTDNTILVNAIKNILNSEMPDFINGELKEAQESRLGEGWLREIMNVQCNKWAVDALNLVKEA